MAALLLFSTLHLLPDGLRLRTQRGARFLGLEAAAAEEPSFGEDLRRGAFCAAFGAICVPLFALLLVMNLINTKLANDQPAAMPNCLVIAYLELRRTPLRHLIMRPPRLPDDSLRRQR